MTPPLTPPEKRPDRHYNFGRMNMVFALSSLALLAVTLWMVIFDYAQPWKRYQAEFRTLERQKLLSEMKAERDRINQSDLLSLRQEIKAGEKALSSQRGRIEKLESEIRELKTREYAADAGWRGAKAVIDETRFQYDAALQHGGAVAKRKAAAEEARRDLDAARADLDRIRDSKAAKEAELAELRQSVTAAEEKLAALRSGVESLETRAAALNKGIDYFLLNAPLMDFLVPTLKIEQAILPGITHNINFTEINRVDRCMTCHVAANRPGFDEAGKWEAPEPFRTHPRLDLFVGDGSPHPYTQFGCTVCHGGLDRATEFSRAGHSPRDEKQRKEWEAKYGWQQQQFLEYPILPSGMSEAGCASCHAGSVWTPKSETQDVGRELIVHMGCNGCHQVNLPAYTGLRKAGPSLTRIAAKTNPGWAYKWIEAPRDFHPTTWMPHFFRQENMQLPANRKRQQVEIGAMVAYLWDKSEKPVYAQLPPQGDPARGKQLFDSVGCAGCHISDANAKRDDFFPKINRLHGPNLVRTGSKVSSGWLYAWLKNPKQYFPDTNMPNLRLTDQEAADLAAWLLSSRDGKYENLSLPAVDAGVRDELALGYLLNVYTVDRAKAKLAEMSDRERSVYLGEQTIAKYGCYGCHDIAGFESLKPIGTELTQEGSKPLHQFDFGHIHDIPHTRHDWIFTKIRNPRIWDEGKEPVKDYNELLKMPNFGASEREARAVAANVLGFTRETAAASRKAAQDSRSSTLAEGRKIITRFNCQGCHLIEEHGHAIQQVIQDPAMLPPNLAAEGARVQADWLFSYLHDPEQVRMRPWLTVRMPTFGFSDHQANSILSYFEAREARMPFLSPPQPALARDLAVGGAIFTISQCARCHPSGPTIGTGASTAELAPSLLLAGDRLRHDWVPDWIKDPQSWVPGTRMPNFFQKSEDGQYSSPFAMGIDGPAYAAFKAQMLQHFGSEAELKAYLADPDKVAGALRDYIWSLSGGMRRPPALAAPGGGVETMTSGAAGGR